MHALSSAGVASTSLPRPLTTMRGREADLDLLLGLVEDPATRLVTLIGPGGVGKTRLALHLAATLVDEFGRDVVFVPLAAIRDPSLVLPAIAQALDLTIAAVDQVEDRLAESLHGRDLLLVLDNMEQVLSAAPAIARLLGRLPTLKALVTSRAALDLPGEQRLPLAPLSTPQADVPAAGIRDSAAVALFIDRARAVQPALQLTDQAMSTVAAICRRLDGLPLAIELAAARVNILSPEALLARLDNRLQVLGGERRGVPDRLKTMRHAIAWSYDLLPPPEQALFRRVSVFAGGFALDAVEAICAGLDGAADPWQLLGALVDHSLVQAVPAATGETRYVMLETLREYGLEQLAAHGEDDAARLAHAAWVVDLAETAEPHLATASQQRWFLRLEAEWDNIRAACTWALASSQPWIPLRVFGAIYRFGYSRGHGLETRSLLDHALAATAGAETRARARALVAAGSFAEDQRDLDQARDLLGRARDLAARIDAPTEELRALIGLCHAAHDGGDYAAAIDLITTAIDLATRIDDRRHLASAIGAMGNVHYLQGNVEGAGTCWERARAIVSALGDVYAEASLVGNLGALALARGDYPEAAALQERSLALGRSVDDLPTVAFALINLAETWRMLGDIDRAETCIAEGSRILHDLGMRGNEGQAQHIHASLALARGNLVQAVALQQQSQACFVEAGDQRDLADNAVLLAEICVARAASEPAIELLAAASSLRERLGIELSPVQQQELAGLTANLRRQVSAAAYDRTWRTGRDHDVDRLVTCMTDIATSLDPGAGPAAPPATAPDPLAELSPREREVLALLVEGRSAREVGDALYISPRTATTHINNIYGKLGVSTRAQAVALALRAGFQPQP